VCRAAERIGDEELVVEDRDRPPLTEPNAITMNDFRRTPHISTSTWARP